MKQYDDKALAEAYLIHQRCRIVAEMFGCSDETVRRALIKYDIPRIIRNPRPVTRKKATEEELHDIVTEYYGTNANINDLAKKYHRSQYVISNAIKRIGTGLKVYEINGKKIDDQELIKCVNNGLTCSQIAKKYSMSPERVYQRGKKLGIIIHDNYSGGHWRRRSRVYGCEEFDESITLEEVIKKDHGICQICGLLVDKTDIDNGHVKKMYPTVDHIIPLSKGGTHTWGNVRLAHMKCNAWKCDKLNTR